MKRNIIIGVSLALLFFFAATATYVYRLYNRVLVPVTETSRSMSRFKMGPTPTPDPLAPKNILLLGYGGAGHDGGSLTDTMILAHIIPRENEVVLISIPRDMWVPIPINEKEEEMYKINHAYAVGIDDEKYPDKPDKYNGLSGGGLLAKEKVEEVTGLNVDHFIAVDFNGFRNIVNLLGGVNINVPYAFTDNYYPIKGEEDNTCGKSNEVIVELEATLSAQLLEKEFTCRYETLSFEVGQQLMETEKALKFVRSRHSDVGGGDFGRSLRQQQFLVGIKNELLKVGSVPKLIPLLNTLSVNVLTDVSISDATSLLLKQGNLPDVNITSVTLSTDNALTETVSLDGQYILISNSGVNNWDSVHTFISNSISDTP
jgi:anionic cell wall polymer biosynthesis LytR-Cps2A-Psr (LCP) family protein